MRTTTALSSLWLMVRLIDPLFAQPSPALPSGYQTDPNLLYRKGGDESEYERERCRLDVYYPTDRKGFATVVWFHGGGLTEGMRSIHEGLKGKGMAVVAAGYRLSPRVKSPVYIEADD
jgi:acetyl esterase/lipase